MSNHIDGKVQVLGLGRLELSFVDYLIFSAAMVLF
jgi:hypothetical protein